MMEQQLLEQLAQDNQQLTAKCAELEKQISTQKSESWIVFVIELGLLFSIGFFLGNWQGNWQGYDRGYSQGSESWQVKYCELKFPKNVQEFNKCRS